MVKFTKRQWLTLIVISIADFANAICVSLQAPFYPQEVRIDNYRFFKEIALVRRISTIYLEEKFLREAIDIFKQDLRNF